jgi:hypothetical protein
MPEVRIQRFQAQAKEKERYDWLGAVELHSKALTQVLKQKDFLKAAEIREQMGFCFFKAALQAETRKDFNSRMRLGVGGYERATELFEKVDEEGKRARMNHSKARAAYASSWLEPDPSKKRELLDECRKLEKEVLKARARVEKKNRT